MDEMGMTDKQFTAYVRSLLRSIEEARKEQDTAAKDDKLDKIIKDLQATIED